MGLLIVYFAGVIVLVGVVIAIFIVLIRRGHFQPVRRRAARAKSAIVRKTRQTFYGKPSHTRNNVYTYDVSILPKHFLWQTTILLETVLIHRV